MALTPSAIPFAPPGSPIAANPDAAVADESGAVPGGFLGLLGTMAGAPLATVPTLEGQALVSGDTLPGLAAEESVAGTLSGTAVELAPAEDAVPPEAAAAAMAVMAQMLAGTQAVVPVETAAPAPSTPALLVPPPQVRQAGFVQPPAAVQQDACAVQAALAVQPGIPLPIPDQKGPAATVLSRPAVAESIDPTPVPTPGKPVAQPTNTSAFQSLTALLAGTARSEGVDAAPAETPKLAGEASRNGAAFATLLATSPVSGDAATADAQQPVLIREPVGTAQWADSIGVRLTMMATRGEQHGSLRLSPEHLGPVEVQIRTQDDGKASVWFGAQHADTRAALQDALPRLRELFAAQGMQLGDAGVSRDPPRQQAAQAGGSSPGFGGGNGEAGPIEELTVALPAAPLNRHAGLLDTYA